MRNINRRQMIWGLVVGAATPVVLTSMVQAEADLEEWVSQVIALPRQPDLSEPPIVTAVAIHPAGGRVAIGGDDHTVQIWDVVTRERLRSLSQHRDWVQDLAYSPDGTMLASVGNDGRMLVWDAETGAVRLERQSTRQLRKLTFDREGAQLYTVGFRDQLRTIQVASGTETAATGCPCVDTRAVALSGDNRWIAAGGRNGRVRVWSVSTGQVHSEFAAHRQRIRGLVFTAGNDQLISCSEDRTIRVSELDGGLHRAWETGTKNMTVALCGGARLASGGADNLVRVWDLETHEQIAELKGHTGTVATLSYAHEILVSAGFDTEVRIWRLDRNVAGERRDGTPRLGVRSHGALESDSSSAR